MNKSDLVEKLIKRKGLFVEDDVELSVNSIIELLSATLQNGGRVEIRKFGSFSIRKREKHLSRNPKTGSSVLVGQKYHPYFRSSKLLKESINKQKQEVV